MSDDDQNTTELPTTSPDAFAAAMTLIAVALDPRACSGRLGSIREAEAKAAKATASANEALSALNMREADIAAQAKRLAERTAELNLRQTGLDGRKGELAEEKKQLHEQDKFFRGRVMLLFGITRHPLQDMPTWDEIRSHVVYDQADAHIVADRLRHGFEPAADTSQRDDDFADRMPPDVSLSHTSPARTAPARRALRAAVEG
jgi:hypothetical protein